MAGFRFDVPKIISGVSKENKNVEYYEVDTVPTKNAFNII
jgi:hypothetical protein